ncbi:MAG: sulfofructose kinase [Acidobacteriota bacterium]
MGQYEQILAALQASRHRGVDVVGFGEVTVDWICRVPRYPAHDTKVRMEPPLRRGGGQIATACCQCARYGLRTRFVGRIGEDDLADFLREDLEGEPLEAVLVPAPEGRTHLSIIIVDQATGGRTIVFDHDERLAWPREALRREWIADARMLHLDAHDVAAALVLAGWARELGAVVTLDIDLPVSGWPDLAAATDVFICGSHFLEAAYPDERPQVALRRVAGLARGLVVATAGKEGAAVVRGDEVVHFPAFPVDVIDTTAAGDMFHGGFIYGLLQGWPLEDTVRFANAAGGLACRRFGARPAIPELREVLELAGLAGG